MSTAPARAGLVVRYVGPAQGRELIGVGELSRDYIFSPANALTERLAPADHDWFATAPGDEFVIEPAPDA